MFMCANPAYTPIKRMKIKLLPTPQTKPSTESRGDVLQHHEALPRSAMQRLGNVGRIGNIDIDMDAEVDMRM